MAHTSLAQSSQRVINQGLLIHFCYRNLKVLASGVLPQRLMAMVRNIQSTYTYMFIKLLTWCNFPVLSGRAVFQHVFHLQELVRPVPTDDGETEAHRAFLQ